MSVRTRLLVASAAIISFAALALVPAVSASSQRTGMLHLAKECSKYTGAAGDYCTIVSSNVDAIKPGSRVYYLEALGGDLFDGDVMLYAGHGNAAFGHCKVDYSTAIGRCTLMGGVGQFQDFRANVVVSPDPANRPRGTLGREIQLRFTRRPLATAAISPRREGWGAVPSRTFVEVASRDLPRSVLHPNGSIEILRGFDSRRLHRTCEPPRGGSLA